MKKIITKRAWIGLWIWANVCGFSLWADETKAAAFPRRVIKPIEFVEGNVTGEVNDELLAKLLNRKLIVGAKDGYEFLKKDADSDYLRTETVAQYRKARAEGAGPWTTFDISMDGFFVNAGGVLRFLEKSKDAEKSAFKDNWMRQLSMSLTGWAGSDERLMHERDTAAGVSLADYARDKKIQFKESSAKHLEFETEYRLYEVDWEASGDYDGDGFEDRLISMAWYYKGGTGRGYDTYLAKYPDPKKSVVLLEDFRQVEFRTADEVD
jgi:hypothetical protein